MNKQQIIYRDLGLMDYQAAWEFQEKLLQENVRVKAAVSGLQSAVGSRQPAVGSLQSAVGSPQSAVGSLQSSVVSRQSAVGSPQSSVGSLQSSVGSLQPAVGSPQSESTSHSPLSTCHYLLFVEHPPVYTLGKSGNKENVLLGDEELRERNIQFFHTNRGGDITFHGAGQIVGYPILDLEKFETDIGKYLRRIEEVIILTLAEYGIKGDRSAGETGVWIDPGVPGKERKICAIGVRCSRWVTMHGFAFNINTDLSYFNHIIPCGIIDKQVTSLEKELERKIDMEEAKEKVKQNFGKVFDAELV